MAEITVPDNLQDLMEELNKVLRLESGDPCGPTYQSLRKLNAKCLLRVHKPYDAAYNLVEALAPSVRTMAAYRCDTYRAENSKDGKSIDMTDHIEKLMKDITPEDYESDELLTFLYNDINDMKKTKTAVALKKPAETIKPHEYIPKEYIQHVMDNGAEMPKMREKLKDLPPEWTVVQLTAGYEPCELWETQKVIRATVKDFYITLLKGKLLTAFNLDPFTTKIHSEVVKYGEKPVFEELHSTLEENLFVIENNLRATNNSLRQYWEKRADSDLRMKGVILTMDRKWLGGWRTLLRGNLPEELQTIIIQRVEDARRTNKITLNKIQMMLICSLAGSSHFVSPSETSSLLRKIYLDHCEPPAEASPPCRQCGETKRIQNLCVCCHGKEITSRVEFKTYRKTFIDTIEQIKNDEALMQLREAKLGPVILLVDEKLDTFPWEALPCLHNQPVTRMECLGFLYGLYKTHQDQMQHGYYQLMPKKGSFVINPGGDLKKMEKRMSAFIDYWCPDWEGEVNKAPPPETFQKHLQESDIFLYCGHNDGSQYLGAGAGQLRGARAVATLSGCGSVRLRMPGTRLLPLPVHANYHLATCPMVIGMLWEVTDLEVDKVTSMLLGLFLPSQAPTPWGHAIKTQWAKTQKEDASVKTDTNSKYEWEPDLLRAVSAARRFTSYVMIAASIVSRGLPVRIHPNFKVNEQQKNDS